MHWSCPPIRYINLTNFSKVWKATLSLKSCITARQNLHPKSPFFSSFPKICPRRARGLFEDFTKSGKVCCTHLGTPVKLHGWPSNTKQIKKEKPRTNTLMCFSLKFENLKLLWHNFKKNYKKEIQNKILSLEKW